MSTFSDFLKENDLTPDQVVTRSKALESYSPEDRAKRVVRETARREKKSYEDSGASADKPKALGRGVTLRTINDAMNGTALTRVSRKKVTRAVSSLLKSAGKEPVDWRALFPEVGSRKGKAKGKK